MNIAIVTPEPPTENAGHAITAKRWSQLLRDLRHDTEVIHTWQEAPDDPELLIALGAGATDETIEAYADAHPDRPLVVSPNTDDLYGGGAEESTVAANLERADAIVVFQPRALDVLPEDARDKAHVIHQSVGRLAVVDALRQKWSEGPDASRSLPDELKEGGFNVVVAAHLRDGKDPLLTARAAEQLASDSDIHISHVGRALDPSWEEKANNEDRTNTRYTWHGEVTRSEALRLIAAAGLVTSTSRIEAGPNVLSEGIALGTPILATEIPGHAGLLGADYPGYVPVGDVDALTEALDRAEREGNFYRALKERGRRLRKEVEPKRERRAWRELLDDLT